ncbi:nucleolar complex protein 14 [Tulasnella sp. JGI-2019a]|nr:nucleolar complex protein 14 [Tulasnella sp. JGI-2019a]
MVKQGGSQLSQLKSALQSAGLSRTSSPKSSGKKRKRGEQTGAPTSAEKDKRAARLETITRKLNPFEDKVTKVKRDVPGQKVKGVRGRPGVSKQAGLEHRKRTLLVEFDQRGRVGGVIDRRFGEDDPDMTVEQKMLERYAREKQRTTKFNFDLGEEDELTHYGKSLNALDDFDSSGLRLEDGSDIPGTHTSRFEDSSAKERQEDEEEGPPRKKSKAEVMSELIEKSKKHKHERQAQKEQDIDLRQQLDEEFGDIRDLLFAMPAPESTKPATWDSPAATTPRELHAAETSVSLSVPITLRSGTDDYDRTVKELFYEQRAQPTDRIRTEEEVAAEEKAKLEKAERARLRRMNGEEDYDSEDEDTRASRRREKMRIAQGDDLDDDFFDEEGDPFDSGLGADLSSGKHPTAEDKDGSEGDSENGESDEDDESEDDGGSDENSLLDSDAEDLDEALQLGAEELVASRKRDHSTKPKSKDEAAPTKELPFTFPCPQTHEEFLDIIEDIDDMDIPTVVQRIRVMYHPSLAEGNKDRLEAFTVVLIEHVLYAARSSEQPYPLLNALSSHIFSLTKSYGATSAKTFVSKLVIMQANAQRAISQSSKSADARTFPGPAELVFLRLIGVVWSTSDLWHLVVAPAMLLIGQYLSQGRVRSLVDVGSGLFLCTLYLQFQAIAHRLMPEVVNFLLNVCLILSPHTFTRSTLPGSFPAPYLDFKLLALDATKSKKLGPRPPNFAALHSHTEESTEQNKVDLLSLAFNLLAKYAELYKSSSGFIEMFEPVYTVIEALHGSAFSLSLEESRSKLLHTLGRLLKFTRQSRQPLQLQDHRPIAIPSVVPSFETDFSHRKHGQEKDDHTKLKSMYKKEKKSAIRELRKDNRFLAAEKAKRQAEKDREYNERMSRVVGGIAPERAEEKKMERIKGIQKMRAGKEGGKR